MRFSIIVPAYNAEADLPSLLESLSNQTIDDFEVIVVDDCSRDDTPKIARSYLCKVVQLSENHGPAYCRNIGAKNAKGDILVFTDSDCKVDLNWLKNISRHFSQNTADAIMGRLVMLPSTFLGDSISALGFPAGGAIGFDKIWRVDKDGFTDSLSSCNCAIKKNIFWEIGGFDESFPYPGGEDSLLAYCLVRLNYKIRYCPGVVAYHSARDSLRGFLKWQFRRGMSSFIFSTKISNKKNFLLLRLWSTENIIRYYCPSKRLPLVLFLLGTSFFVQFVGFLFAKYDKDFYESINH